MPQSEREQLASLVEQWNENRLDLFHISYPTEDLEIEGVMRFYFQDGGERVLTKCVRVSSTATTRVVVEALTEKFLPDLKMLSDDTYSLWELHESGDERKLDDEEKPLLVQLTWHRDDREGRFLLRKSRQANVPLATIQLPDEQDIKRSTKRFSKREKKELKKKHQKDIITVNSGREEALGPVIDLYCQVPPNSFTRTISNPEVVMKKRREKKLETRLKELGHGELVPSRPYVTILVSVNDCAEKILLEALEKYGFDLCNISDYVLVEMATSDQANSSFPNFRNVPREGRIVSLEEKPLMQMAACGAVPETYLALKRKPKHCNETLPLGHDSSFHNLGSQPSSTVLSTKASYLLCLSEDGVPLVPQRCFPLSTGVTEIGSDRSLAQFSSQNILLMGEGIRSRHCVITYVDGIATITPSASEAVIEINNHQICQTEILRDRDLLKLGLTNHFIFIGEHKHKNNVLPHSDYSTLSSAVNGSSLSLPSTRHQDDKVENVYLTQASISNQPSAGMGSELICMGANLPISLQIGDYKVWDYLAEVISRGWMDAGSFRLSPAYSLYLALKFFHSHSKAYLVQFFTRICHHMSQISQECTSQDELLFWLANASELSFLIGRDHDLRSQRTGQLIASMENIFRRLCTVLVSALKPGCKTMLDVTIPIEDGTNELLSLLDGTLRAARASRLNAALTIQLCSHVLHAVNATLFNALVGVSSTPARLTSRLGKCLQARLAAIHRWAEHMGVELAAECHLDRSRQAATLLAAQKNDVAALGTTCYKLNSVQVRFLLTHFVADTGEIPCDDDVVVRVIGLAERQADNLTVQDGHPITLAEPEQLLLPFLFPQDGYTAEQLRGVPDGLYQYLLSLQEKGLCHSVLIQETNVTSWQSSPSASTADMHRPTPSTACSSPHVPTKTTVRSPSQSTLGSLPTTQFGDSISSTEEDIIRVMLKRAGCGIGLSIVAAQGVGDRQIGIYVKKVVTGSPAALDGRLAAGDQLLSVNGKSLLGISQEEAAECMARAGAEVHLIVRKGAALRNGLDIWLCKPAPPTVLKCLVNVDKRFSKQLSYFHAVPPIRHQVSCPSQYSLNQTQDINSEYSHYTPLHEYSSQVSMQTVNGYQKNQPGARTSAFAPVLPISSKSNRHMRSVSASDLHQSDPNTSFAHRSVSGSAVGVSTFDRLPSHYRHSNRPTVIQPGRPSATSPSALRRNAQSPAFSQRPPSVNNLFAPPKTMSPMLQQGYSSSIRDSNHDFYGRTMPSPPPAAHSSPREDRVIQPIPSSHYPASTNALSLAASTDLMSSRMGCISSTRHIPRSPTSSKSLAGFSNRNVNHTVTCASLGVPRPQEMRPSEQAILREEIKTRERPRPTTTFGVMAPTSFTQALQATGTQEAHVILTPPRPTGFDRELRNLEKTNSALVMNGAVNEELDRLDAKGINMTEEETRRYRELVNAVSEHPRMKEQKSSATVAPTMLASTETYRPSSSHRTETLIDDVDESLAKSTMIENISPGDVSEHRTVHYGETVSYKESDIVNSPSIYGTCEIYRDPRQQRLNELQDRQKAQSRAPENMGFRDKMRMFATHLGETTPKPRYSASSAERQIRSEQ